MPLPRFAESDIKDIKVGDILTLTESIKDPYSPLPCGLKGKVSCINDLNIVMSWENGSNLNLLPEDMGKFKKVDTGCKEMHR